MLRTRTFRTYVLVIVTFCCSHFFGAFDHIFSTPFSMFRWPPFVDVREQVELRLRGESSSVTFENDWESVYQYRLRPRSKLCGDGGQPLVLIAVKSDIGHFERRATIRQLWGKEHRNNTTLLIATIFVLGRSTDAAINRKASEESSNYGDVLMGDYVDAYSNNTFKLISALQFVVQWCGMNVNYALLVDDDYHVSIRNLVFMLFNSSATAQQDLYAGYRFDTSPFRNRLHKHFVSLSVYPFSAYPPYISAGAVVLSSVTARKMLYASHFVRYFPYDDIYAGIMAYLLGIEPTHDERFRFWQGWRYDRKDFVDVVAAHGFSDLQLMRQAFSDSDGGVS